MPGSKEITIELDTAIKFSLKGSEQDGNFLTISPPTGRIAGLVGELKSQLGSATRTALTSLTEEMKSNAEAVDGTDDTPEEIGEASFMMLTMGGASMPVVMATFCSILKETALINGEGKFTSPIFDRMAYDDIEKALKIYIGNFITAS